MISQTQTAKKGETRQALLATAGENPEEKLDANQLKDKTADGDSLDNPFMNTAAAAGLGVPLMNERTQKIALAAQAADPNDERGAKLLAKAASAKRIADAQTATVDLREPAPPIDRIVAEATLEVSTNIESTAGTAPVPQSPAPAKAPAKTRAKTTARKPVTRKPAAKTTTAKTTTTKTAAARRPPAKTTPAKPAPAKTAGTAKTSAVKPASAKTTTKTAPKTTSRKTTAAKKGA